MSDVLHAWRDGALLGRFERTGDDVSFRYAPHAPSTPVSLSLPRDGSAPRRAAARYLDNLLPDSAGMRVRLAYALGAASTEPMDLLAVAGGDVAGGLVLTPDDAPPSTDPPDLERAQPDDIAARIARLKQDPSSWLDRVEPTRFSLAGTQGKFALALVRDRWHWPNATVPSTHIIKPAWERHPELEEAESAALALARDIGLAAPDARILTVEDQQAFVVERFDRAPNGPIARRLHVEDLAQALAVPPDRKYEIGATQIIRRLRAVQDAPDLPYDFVRQLAFNVVIGNADAHAKNYSLHLDEAGVRMTPLYDAVPIGLYPQYDQRLAMQIGGAKHAAEVTPAHWSRLATSTGLDADRVVDVAREVARDVAAHAETAWTSLSPSFAGRLQEQIGRNARSFGGTRLARSAAADRTGIRYPSFDARPDRRRRGSRPSRGMGR